VSADLAGPPVLHAGTEEEVPGTVTWPSVLDSLEATLDDLVETGASEEAVEQAITLAGWTPPELGPLPDALVARARRINERQQSALMTLAEELTALRRHRSALDSVHTATAPQQSSVYLDVTG
jgi:hypothetical protein